MVKKSKLSLFDKLLIASAIGTSIIAVDRLSTYREYTPAPIVNPVEQNKLPEKAEQNKLQDLETKLKTFEDYRHVDVYDNQIIKYTNFWNEEFKGIQGYNPLDPNLVKSIIIQESGSPKDKAFKFDPMQIANKGDYALKVLRGGLENFMPKGGYEDLRNITETPGKWIKYKDKDGKKKRRWVWLYKESPDRINVELSIKYGIRWLIHKSFIFDKNGNPNRQTSWEDAVESYNGKGTLGYTENILNRFNH